MTISPLVAGLSPAQAKPPAHAKAHGYRAKQNGTKHSGKWRNKKSKNRRTVRYDDRRYDDRRYDDRRYDSNYERELRRREQIEAANSVLGGLLAR
jgi:hypothetical protein